MNIDDLVTHIENFLAEYDPYGFNDTYNSWTPTEESFKDIKSQILDDIDYYIQWFSDVAEDDISAHLKDEASTICNALKYLSTFQDISDIDACSITGDTDLFGIDYDEIFTREDLQEYVEQVIYDEVAGVTGCRAYIDKIDGKYVLSVDMDVDDYSISNINETLDLRKVRKPSDLSKYAERIIDQFYELVGLPDGVDLDTEIYDDPTQYGDLNNPITPWSGSIN